MSFVFASCHAPVGKEPLRAVSATLSEPLPERPPSARLDSRWRGADNVQGWLCDEDVPVLAASDRERRELTERHRLPGTLPPERRWALRRQRNGRTETKRCGAARTERPRPPGEASTTGAAQRALALEPGSFRYAYRTGHAARCRDVARSLENRMETSTLVGQTPEDDALSLRTSLLDSTSSRSIHWILTASAHRTSARRLGHS